MDHLMYTEPPITGDETSQLLGVLERTRGVLAWKCGGLDAEAMRTTLGPSAVTLGGLLKHLAWVEVASFVWKLSGGDPGAPWNAIDWENEPDWEWRTAADDSPEELFAMWHASVQRSREAVAAALAEGGMDHEAHISGDDGVHVNLRRIVLDMIDEYARHNGQADLVRESIDGLVGEDPPGRPEQ
jgi:hypothetical protein